MEGFFILLILLIGFIVLFAFVSSVFNSISKSSGIFGIILSLLFLGFLFGSDDDIDDC